mmetsp:Transcript_45134/g.89603  ORF Transcript_45134/g.89603 Transcript_45134/m.89603 type:complete len:212 (-) Transcript_45134:236-871(-)
MNRPSLRGVETPVLPLLALPNHAWLSARSTASAVQGLLPSHPFRPQLCASPPSSDSSPTPLCVPFVRLPRTAKTRSTSFASILRAPGQCGLGPRAPCEREDPHRPFRGWPSDYRPQPAASCTVRFRRPLAVPTAASFHLRKPSSPRFQRFFLLHAASPRLQTTLVRLWLAWRSTPSWLRPRNRHASSAALTWYLTASALGVGRCRRDPCGG